MFQQNPASFNMDFMAPERISSELFVPGPHRSILNSPFEPRAETAESYLAGLC